MEAQDIKRIIAKANAPFNEASQKAGLIRDALKTLEDETHGKVKFTEERSGDDVLLVSNIPVQSTWTSRGGPQSTLTVRVTSDGTVKAKSDDYEICHVTVETNVKKRHADEKIVQFVTKTAVSAGMI